MAMIRFPCFDSLFQEFYKTGICLSHLVFTDFFSVSEIIAFTLSFRLLAVHRKDRFRYFEGVQCFTSRNVLAK